MVVVTFGIAGATVLGTSTGAWAGKSKHSTISAKQLKALTKSVKGGTKESFKAVYDVTEPGKSETITFEQAPPKSLLETTSGSVIDTGTTTLFCSSSGGTETCVSEGAGQSNPFAEIEDLFSPTAAENYFSQAAAEFAARKAGYALSFSTARYGGQASKCVTATGKGTTGKYCVNGSGILTYVGAASATVTITSFSKNPPASDFEAPAGATVETLPSGVSIP
jgi:hypothetical protein